ncbi:hypothetical protein [Peptoniphilus duerdenii]|uniref:hypothetical protein n=1 Tax=Peptoniphilus duerdenii TaxID=507750 RepID=UPI0023F39BAB|nr:hypothetical protein [Peptoniphilus duerdenii]
MKIKERYHSYPVLAPYTDDYPNTLFSIKKLEDIVDRNNYVFEVELNLNNKGLEKLINEQLAEFVIHVECSKTSFRRIFKSSMSTLTLQIEKSKIDSRVEFAPFIIAKEDIKNYTDIEFDPIFEGFSFNINRGQYLAIGKVAIITIIKDKDDLKQLSSIIRIAQVADLEKGIKLQLEGDRIQILMPKETYEMYIYASRNHNRLRLLHSMIVLPAIINVLYELKDDAESNFEQFSDRRWFQALEIRINDLGLELDKRLFSDNTPYELAQLILEYPVEEALDKIYEADQEDV